jgi:hypothetical protein
MERWQVQGQRRNEGNRKAEDNDYRLCIVHCAIINFIIFFLFFFLLRSDERLQKGGMAFWSRVIRGDWC